MFVKHILPGGDLSDAYNIRGEVFVEEQGFSVEIEMDDTDPAAHHVVLYDGARPVATARTFPEEPASDRYVVGRVAVRRERRGDGAGRVLMDEIESVAAELGARVFTLGAQMQAAGFYRKCGYAEYGEHYYEEHCEHVHMKKEL